MLLLVGRKLYKLCIRKQVALTWIYLSLSKSFVFCSSEENDPFFWSTLCVESLFEMWTRPYIQNVRSLFISVGIWLEFIGFDDVMYIFRDAHAGIKRGDSKHFNERERSKFIVFFGGPEHWLSPSPIDANFTSNLPMGHSFLVPLAFRLKPSPSLSYTALRKRFRGGERILVFICVDFFL